MIFRGFAHTQGHTRVTRTHKHNTKQLIKRQNTTVDLEARHEQADVGVLGPRQVLQDVGGGADRQRRHRVRLAAARLAVREARRLAVAQQGADERLHGLAVHGVVGDVLVERLIEDKLVALGVAREVDLLVFLGGGGVCLFVSVYLVGGS